MTAHPLSRGTFGMMLATLAAAGENLRSDSELVDYGVPMSRMRDSRIRELGVVVLRMMVEADRAITEHEKTRLEEKQK